jgi:hypothetical protein
MSIDLNVHNQQDPDPEEGNDPTHVEGHPNGVDSDDSDDGFSDASSDVTELGSADFEPHFQERDERLFHSHGGLPYPLPVDTPEQEVGCCVLSSRLCNVAMLRVVRRSA